MRIHHVKTVVKRMRQAELMIVPGKSGMDIWRDRAAMQAITRFIAKGFGEEIDIASAQRRRPKAATYPAGLSLVVFPTASAHRS
jgi:hypothetical protein